MTEQRPGTGDEPKPDTHQQPQYGHSRVRTFRPRRCTTRRCIPRPASSLAGSTVTLAPAVATASRRAPTASSRPAVRQYGQQYNQQYSSPYGQPSYYGAAPQPKSLSIASLCCGIAVYLGFGVFILPQLAAVILGHMALRREPSGRGFAIAGLVMGYLGLALTVLAIVGLAILASLASTSSTI